MLLPHRFKPWRIFIDALLGLIDFLQKFLLFSRKGFMQLLVLQLAFDQHPRQRFIICCEADIQLFIDIADGIRWAAGLPVDGVPANAHPAKVMNLSLGGYAPSGSQIGMLRRTDTNYWKRNA